MQIQTQFHDDHLYPTEENVRLQAAAVALVYTLTALKLDVSDELKADAANEFADKTIHLRTIHDTMVHLYQTDRERFNALYKADASAGLRDAWTWHRRAARDYSLEPLLLRDQLMDKKHGTVRLHFKAPMPNGWKHKGSHDYPDAQDVLHSQVVNARDLLVKTGKDGGGEYTYLTWPSQGDRYLHVVRVEDGKLVTNDPNKISWMPWV